MTIETPDRVRTDDWDAHWREYTAANALNPASLYRPRLIFQLLTPDDAAGPVRLLDLGCGQGELATHAPRARPDAPFARAISLVLSVELSTMRISARGPGFAQPLSSSPRCESEVVDIRARKTLARLGRVTRHKRWAKERGPQGATASVVAGAPSVRAGAHAPTQRPRYRSRPMRWFMTVSVL